MYSCHLFLISSASVRSIPFLSFIEPSFAWNVPLVSLIILKRSLAFPILLFSSISLHDHWGRLSYLSWLFFGTLHLNGCIFPLLFTSLLFTALCKASSDSHFAFLHCLFLDMVLIPASYTMSLLFISQLFVSPPQATSLPFCIASSWVWFWWPPIKCHDTLSIAVQALFLSDLIAWILLSLPLYNHRDLIYFIPEWSSGFLHFLQFLSEFGNKEFMIWATVSSQSCFCWLYKASPSLAAKNIISLILVLTIWWCPCVGSSLMLLEEGVCCYRCILLAELHHMCICAFISRLVFLLRLSSTWQDWFCRTLF